MCNLYSMTKNVDAIRRLFGALNSQVGNLPSLPGIFPDYLAPIVRNAAGDREIVMARWGAVIAICSDGIDQEARAKTGGQG
jgi:putative SOS response-associated peptidase YedK